MKKLFSYLLICSLLGALLACGDDNVEPGTATERGIFYEDAQLEIYNNENGPSWANPVSGEKLVFQYTYVHPDNPDIADDERSEVLRWEATAESHNFVLTDLALHKAFYFNACFCELEPTFNITGRITGERQNPSRWKVNIDIVVYAPNGEESISTQQIFELQPLN